VSMPAQYGLEAGVYVAVSKGKSGVGEEVK